MWSIGLSFETLQQYTSAPNFPELERVFNSKLLPIIRLLSLRKCSCNYPSAINITEKKKNNLTAGLFLFIFDIAEGLYKQVC